jgi:hypothetical protein
MARKKSAARQARAKELCSTIEGLSRKSPGPSAQPESPAAFVQRRMIELAGQKKPRSKSRSKRS